MRHVLAIDTTLALNTVEARLRGWVIECYRARTRDGRSISGLAVADSRNADFLIHALPWEVRALPPREAFDLLCQEVRGECLADRHRLLLEMLILAGSRLGEEK